MRYDNCECLFRYFEKASWLHKCSVIPLLFVRKHPFRISYLLMMIMASAFALGLAGSLHCIGMCGPIAIALPKPAGQSRTAFWQGRLLYNLGRSLTYAAMGALFGLLGQSIHMAGLQQGLSIACGILILLYLATRYLRWGKGSIDVWLVRLVAPLQQALALRLGGGTRGNLFVIGLLNGLLPCGLVYVALAGATASGSVWGGALFMLLFGLGTTPLMLAAGLAGPLLHARLRGSLQWLIPTGLVILAALFILRGLNLGIPYISPRMQEPGGSETPACCSGHHS